MTLRKSQKSVEWVLFNHWVTLCEIVEWISEVIKMEFIEQKFLDRIFETEFLK